MPEGVGSLARTALILALSACGPIQPEPQPTYVVVQQPPSSPSNQPPSVPPPADPPPPAQPRIAPPDPGQSGPPPLAKSPRIAGGGTTQAEIAARRNEEGAQDYKNKLYNNATMKFREAVARVPEARYFYNLCAALFQEGKFSEALTACDAVDRNDPPADLRDPTAVLIARIKYEAFAQGQGIAP